MNSSVVVSLWCRVEVGPLHWGGLLGGGQNMLFSRAEGGVNGSSPVRGYTSPLLFPFPGAVEAKCGCQVESQKAPRAPEGQSFLEAATRTSIPQEVREDQWEEDRQPGEQPHQSEG